MPAVLSAMPPEAGVEAGVGAVLTKSYLLQVLFYCAGHARDNLRAAHKQTRPVPAPLMRPRIKRPQDFTAILGGQYQKKGHKAKEIIKAVLSSRFSVLRWSVQQSAPTARRLSIQLPRSS